MNSRKSPQLLAVLALTAIAAGCGAEDPSPLPETNQVGVVDNRFDPVGNRVDLGQTVTWTWGGSNQHNVTFDNASLSSSDTQMQGTHTQAFPDEGEFTYYCTVHGRSVMSGTVVVGAQSARTPTGGGGY